MCSLCAEVRDPVGWVLVMERSVIIIKYVIIRKWLADSH